MGTLLEAADSFGGIGTYSPKQQRPPKKRSMSRCPQALLATSWTVGRRSVQLDSGVGSSCEWESASASQDSFLPAPIKKRLKEEGCSTAVSFKSSNQWGWIHRINGRGDLYFASFHPFELWCQKRLLRVSWTSRRSNQSILKEINPEYSLEGLLDMTEWLNWTDAKAEAPILWPPDVKSQLIGKDPDARKDWG